MINGTKQMIEFSKQHQNPPPYPHPKALFAAQMLASLVTFYHSPGAFIAYSADIILSKMLSPFIKHPLLKKLLCNFALFGAEKATDYGPYTVGNQQMEILLKEFGAKAYGVPIATLILWHVLPQLADAAMESELGKAAQDFSESLWCLEDKELDEEEDPLLIQLEKQIENAKIMPLKAAETQAPVAAKAHWLVTKVAAQLKQAPAAHVQALIIAKAQALKKAQAQQRPKLLLNGASIKIDNTQAPKIEGSKPARSVRHHGLKANT